jgi:hypothetical protein
MNLKEPNVREYQKGLTRVNELTRSPAAARPNVHASLSSVFLYEIRIRQQIIKPTKNAAKKNKFFTWVF